MTPQERAEIIVFQFAGKTFHEEHDAEKWLIEAIATQIAEALKDSNAIHSHSIQDCVDCKWLYEMGMEDSYQDRSDSIAQKQKYGLQNPNRSSGQVEK